MKIVHLNTYADNGGAGKACSRLNKALQQQGVDSHLWVNFSFGRHYKSNAFATGFLGRGLAAAAIISERVMAGWLLKPLKTPFSFPLFGSDISNHPALRQADIIHLHWINHGFLRPADLAQLRKLNKPIVWTFHDSNAFTGGCHVRYTCNHFEAECGNCPLLKNPRPDDWSHRIWKQKEKAYRNLNINVISPSKWMADSVRRSKLLGHRPGELIPNTLDTSVFKPIEKPVAKQTFGLSVDKFVLLSGFMPSRNDLHKGTPYLLEALAMFAKSVPPERIELLIFGNRNGDDLPDLPVKTTFLGKLDDEADLARCYSAADVFLAPSLEDNLPYTVMESLACGTPVVGFNTGGIPDMVRHQHNGYLAQYRSAADLAAGIQWIYNHPERESLGQNARETIIDLFAEAKIAERHMALYQQLLNRKNS